MTRNNTHRIVGVFLTLLSVLVPAAASAEDFHVEASVNATKIGLDDDLQLTVAIKGDTMGRAGTPELPKLEGFRLGGQSTSTNIQWVNGQMSSTRSTIYTLMPKAEGTHIIEPISVEYGGKEYLTEPIEIEVVYGSILPRSGGRPGSMDPFDMLSPFRRRERTRPAVQEGEVFVTAELSKGSAFVGEQVVLTYRLYTQLQIMGLEFSEQPSLTGFWIEDVEMPQEPQWKETKVDGKDFFVVELKKSVLFPTRSGKITIEPAMVTMGLRAAADPFDVFAPMTESIRRSTKALTVDVKPLPVAGRPADFSGAVGEFTMSAQLDQKETTAGEALTLSVVVEGEGNLKTVESPELPAPPGFRTYDPKTEENLTTRGSRFGGKKRWEYVLVPDSAGQHQIGPMSFSYFDPGEKKYKKLTAGPLTLNVAAATAASSAAAVGSSRGAVQLLRQDIRYLKPVPARLGETSSPFYRSGLFYLTLALPVLWNLGLVVYRKKKQSEAAQVGLWRFRRARKAAQERLKQARKFARSTSMDFYEETAGALYRYVADKLGVSPSGLTAQKISVMLEDRGVPESLRTEFLKTVEACEFARFTPGERTREEMESLLERAEKTIVTMEKHFA